MGSEGLDYSCSKCRAKVSVLDGEVERSCFCPTDTTILAGMSTILKPNIDVSKYYQFLETGKEFYIAALLLKQNSRPSIVYLNLICQAFENISKYIICRNNGYNYCYPDLKKAGKFGHHLDLILRELKNDVVCRGFITVKLEGDINRVSSAYNERDLVYGNLETLFTGTSAYETESIFKFLESIISLLKDNQVE